MATNVRTDNKNLVTEHCRATVFQPVDPVFLKPKGDPGVAPHFNCSGKINNAAGTVRDHKLKVAHNESYAGMGRHAPVVIAGQNSGQKDGDSGFLSFMKNVYIESRNAVMDAAEASVNAMWSMLPPEVRNVIENGNAIAGGLTADDMVGAAQDEAAAMLDALKSTDTLIALLQTVALMGASAIPIVGQIAGGAAVAMRIKSVLDSTAGAAEQLKAMMERWTQPLTPSQIEAERKALASFVVGVGAAALLAALGVKVKLSGRSKGTSNSRDRDWEAGRGPKGNATTCACKTGNPVIIATGEKSLNQTDFNLPGPIPLNWQRNYRSGDIRDGWFGIGWSHELSVTLSLSSDGLSYHDASGRSVALPAVAEGATHFDAYEQFTVCHPSSDEWQLSFKGGRTETFIRPREDVLVLPLASVSDRNGNRVRLEYPAPPDAPFSPWRPKRIHDSAGRMLTLEWDHQGHLNAVRLGDVRLARYQYTATGELRTYQDACGAQWTYDWHSGRLAAYTNGDGATWRAQYDTRGRVTHSWSEADGRGLRFDYQERLRRTNITDSIGRTTSYEHDSREDIVATISPDGTRIETPFDSNGHPRGSVDPMGRKTHYRFDHRGNLIEVVDPEGNQTRTKYNALDLPVSLTDALGHVWQREYDERGNLIATTDPLQRTTRFTHDERGLVHTIVDPRGGVKRISWDAAGNLTQWTDCSGQSTRYTYDALGRLTEQTDALGHRTIYRWDGAERLTELVEPGDAIHRYEWSADGNLTAYVDPLGATTRWRYNPHGDPVERIDANGHRLAYAYDDAGRLTQLTNENGSHTRFHYDINDNLTDEIGFDGRHQRYVYNAAGELTHLIETGGSDAGPGKITRFERDALGRLLRKHSDGDVRTEASFTYDKLGRLVSANNSAARLAFAYDPASQLLSEASTLAGGAEQRLEHTYDSLGNRVRTALPDKRVLNWLFYGSGHLHQLNLQNDNQHKIICDLDRDALHREQSRSQGALTSRYDYDPQGRLLRHRAGPNEKSPLIERAYAWDEAGNLIGRKDAQRGEQRFRYDPVGYIREVLGPRPEHFDFDPAGNLLARDGGAIPDNRVRVFEDLRYTYDEHGNVTERRKGAHETAQFEWDADHRLEQATVTRHGTTQHTRYEYDALGRRTRKRDAFGATEFLWDGDLLIESRRNNKSALYLYEPNSFIPLATVQDGHTYWYHCDQIGTPMELTDQTGQIVWAADYRVWGEATLRKTGTYGERVSTSHLPPPQIEQPFRFQGQHFDDETGLHYNRFRYYDPGVGRFVSQDPIGLWGGNNLFSYSPNPTAWMDLLGLCPSNKPNKHRTRRASIREIKRQLGISMGQQPASQKMVPLTGSDGSWILGVDKKPIMTRELTYVVNGKEVVIQDHSHGHDFGEDGVGNQTSHHNVRPGENTRTGKVKEMHDHYYFDCRNKK